MTVLSPGRPAINPLGLTAYAIAAATVAVDQASKAWVLYGLHLQDRGAISVFPVFRLSLVWNRGFSFGLLSHVDVARWGLLAFSLAVAAVLAIWARRTARWSTAMALGLIIGGAVGNAVDRARLGAVVDFLDFSGLYFPWVFNVADSGITVGVALLLLDSLMTKPEPA